MSVSSVSSTSSLYQTLYSTGSSSTQKASSISSTSGQDTVELSAAGTSASASASSSCPKGNKTCVGCGACKQLSADGLAGTSSTTHLSGTNSQTTDTAMVNAISAYESQIKYL